jgi:hypothetical protein
LLNTNALGLWGLVIMGIAYMGLALTAYFNFGLMEGITGPIVPLATLRPAGIAYNSSIPATCASTIRRAASSTCLAMARSAARWSPDAITSSSS